jgi:hypothetical protein
MNTAKDSTFAVSANNGFLETQIYCLKNAIHLGDTNGMDRPLLGDPGGTLYFRKQPFVARLDHPSQLALMQHPSAFRRHGLRHLFKNAVEGRRSDNLAMRITLDKKDVGLATIHRNTGG